MTSELVSNVILLLIVMGIIVFIIYWSKDK
jgi:hypothetical protein